MAISQDFQFFYTNAEGTSILMGAGTDYDVVDIRGLGMPSVRANDVPRLDTHGALTSRKELLPGRTVNLQVVVQGDPGDGTLDARVTSLSKACQVHDTPGTLTFRFPIGYGVASTTDDDRFLTAYCRRITKMITASQSSGRIPCYIQFECPNPVIRCATQSTSLIELTAFGGGTTFNETFSLGFGTASSLSTLVDNEGNFPAYPNLRFAGPLVDPGIANNTKGQWIQLAGVTIDSGDYVDINFYERSILQSGTTSVYNKLTNDSTWWTLDPGLNSLTFTASSASAVEMTFNWYHSWI